MNTATLYDEIIQLISVAESIDETTRKSMIEEVKRDGLSPAMQERIMALFAAELDGRAAEIAQAEGIIERAREVGSNADSHTLLESQAVTAAFGRETEDITDNLEATCGKESKSVDGAIGSAINKRDETAADKVRQSLKL